MFTLTEAAQKQVMVSAERGDAVGDPLRLAAKRKEDGSIDYLMGFDQVQDDDIRVDCGEVEIVFSNEYRSLLEGATMDYVEIESGEYRFIFLNPNDETYIPPSDG
jgi:iron-sulfur cluster assembly protein